MSDPIRIERDELFTSDVDEALAKERAMSGRIVPEPVELGPVRALVMNPMFHLPMAGLLAAFLTWMLLEPGIEDFPVVGGEVVMVNTDPFVIEGAALSITVEDREVLLDENTRLTEGADGQAAFESLATIKSGDVVEVAGVSDPMNQDRLTAIAIRPATVERARSVGTKSTGGDSLAMLLLFPLTGAMIALGLLVAEGLTTRNYRRMAQRSLVGSSMAMVFSFIAMAPGSMILGIVQLVVFGDLEEGEFLTVHTMAGSDLMLHIVARSFAWAFIGAGLGMGMNIIRSTKVQMRNAIFGGALGGAAGGLFFDPISRFLESPDMFAGAELSRAIGLCAVGLSVGLFVALTEKLAREAWLVVRSGPLAGKSFVLYRTPTTLGSSPQADVYLFKDAEIDPAHAALHKVGATWELEDQGTRHGTLVGGRPVFRHRLSSGDQIVVGQTILQFEERAKRSDADRD